MSALFNKILRQAFKTFNRSNQDTFNANFMLLKQLTEQLTFRDIHLNPQTLADSHFQRPEKAPCTFVQIYENADVSMSVFVLRGNYTMPLHDHPMMHGILRGIYGKCQVLSYTQQLTNPNPALIYDKMARKIDVMVEEPKIVSPETECAILSPSERNFHEITAVGSVAAFFDILSPPYDSNIPIYGSRKCRFYTTAPLPAHQHRDKSSSTQQPEIAKLNPGRSLQLHCIPSPRSYYCDIVKASEEVIECTFICSAEAYSS